jgi:hypothetical protein
MSNNKSLLKIAITFCLTVFFTILVPKFILGFGLIFINGTPLCEVFRDGSGNLCVSLGCTNIGTIPKTGDCLSKTPTITSRCMAPRDNCTNPVPKKATCTTSPDASFASATYTYSCISKISNQETIFSVTYVGPTCKFTCDPNKTIAGNSCRQSPFSQLTSGNGDCPSPIILDLANNGFDLTDAANGVSFDITAAGLPTQIAWTKPGSDDAWLALDRNGNGLIDDGSELFGNFTPQPASTDPNGFLALEVFDLFTNGGNSDGQIDRRDTVANQLLLWQDLNHNGISEAEELQPFNSSKVKSIDLKYQTLRLQDQHGNAFRYRALVTAQPGTRIGRFAYDVFLVSLP